MSQSNKKSISVGKSTSKSQNLPEYYEGSRAYKSGRDRDDCPYESTHGEGWNTSRHAWMVGHLEAQFARRM